MSKKNIIEICKEQTNYTMAHSRNEVNLFCEIMGLPKSKVNYFIGGDPHGVVDIMEGYYCFNMTDIHVVISEYERWLSIYKTNEELRKAVDAWYYYCQEWYEQHSYEGPRWVSVEERLPEKQKKEHGARYEVSNNVLVYTEQRTLSTGYYDYEEKKWHGVWHISDSPKYWFNVKIPRKGIERSKGCPNLRSWLAGCPVDGLREATPEYIEEQRKAQETAHQRVEECKQALYQAMEEEVKLNKF